MGVVHRFNVHGGFRYVRFIILVAAALYLAFVQASIIVFNVAYVEMADHTTSPLLESYLNLMRNQTAFSQSVGSAERIAPDSIDFDWAPSSLPLSQRRYTISSVHKSFAFAGSFAGSLFGTFPMLWLLRYAGARKAISSTMLIIGAVCAVLCGLTPLSISASFWLFVALRFASGFVSAPTLPLTGAIIEDWAAMEEKGLFISCLTGSIEIAMLFTLPVGALIAENISWPATFYIHALICAFFTLTLFLVYRDDPAKHPMLTIEEVKLIKQGKNGATDRAASPSTRTVLSSKAIWAVFIAAMGTYFVAQFLTIFSPQYFTSVLGYSTTIAGTMTIIPTIGLLPVKFITGVVSDRLNILSEVCKLRLFNSLSSFIGASILIVAVFVRPGVADVVATALIILPFIFYGFSTGGFQKAGVMIAREHAPFVFSLMHIFDMVALLAATFIIPLLTPDNTFAVLLISSNVVFTIFVKAEPDAWAIPKV
ncbi:hypothetical protein PRIPAC_79008 [Pristionchus pacificus]|uniref:Membrane transporter n=1 Tax=Pristionchus pacificus TaxID=54126 RepID=A0A2A6CQD7_PRIPA|nr:hypothetical protein PRIPAC_79008 [Pristionchus pacificus]|eukprot:PDM80298.1 membrane transporter [Pristionchus pacificus]